MTSQRSIAEAFSAHRFRETYDALAEDIRWVAVGGDDTEGKDAVIGACEGTLRALAETTTTFDRVLVVDGGDAIAVDVMGRYVDAAGVSVVASCDIYEFRSGLVSRITSYAVDVADE